MTSPAFLLSPRRVCTCVTSIRRAPGRLCPWPAGWAPGDLPRLTQRQVWPLLLGGRAQDHRGLTPASTGSGLHPGVRQSVCTAKAGQGSLSVCPVRAREARRRLTRHPHPLHQRASCFLTCDHGSSPWGPLPHHWGPRITSPSQLPSSPP